MQINNSAKQSPGVCRLLGDHQGAIPKSSRVMVQKSLVFVERKKGCPQDYAGAYFPKRCLPGCPKQPVPYGAMVMRLDQRYRASSQWNSSTHPLGCPVAAAPRWGPGKPPGRHRPHLLGPHKETLSINVRQGGKKWQHLLRQQNSLAEGRAGQQLAVMFSTVLAAS